MKPMLRLFWRVCYPVLLYAFLLAAASDIITLGGFFSAENRDLLSAGMAAGAALLFFAPIYQAEHRQVQPIGLRHSRPVYAELVCVGAGLCLTGNLLMIWSGISSAAYQQTEARLFAPDIRLQVLLIGALIPAAEELIFRGMCFERLRQAADFRTAAILSALLFGWFHGNIVQGIYAFAGGLFMAWGYERCHHLSAAWLIHGSSNLLSLVFRSEAFGGYSGNGRFHQAAVFLAGICLLLAGVVRINKKRSGQVWEKRG